MRFFQLTVLTATFLMSSLSAQISTDTVTGTDISTTSIPAVPAVAPAPQQAPSEPAKQPVDIGSGPWKICSIGYEGLFNIKEKVVRKQVRAPKEKNYEQGFVDKDIQAVMGLGMFDNVSVDVAPMPVDPRHPDKTADCWKITYIVVEKPIIKDIVIKGNDEFSKGRIKDAMDSKKKDSFDSIKIREDMNKIEAKYNEKGYISAKAEYSVEQDTAAHTVLVTVTMNEGRQAKVKSVDVIGAKQFTVKKLVGELKNRPKKVFKKEEVDKDPVAMKEYCQNKGFPEFSIERSSVVFNADKSEVYITYWINEGVKAKFGKTTFSGNTAYSEQELRAAIDYKQGKLYKEENMKYTVAGIQEKYADKGYLKMILTPEKKFNEAADEMDINFRIQENEIFYVGQINVSGNKSTKTFVFTREILLKDGDVFRASRLRKSQERIMNLGFIDDVQPDFTPSAEDPSKLDIDFDIVEGKPGMLTMGAAVSSSDGLYGQLGITHLNFLHRAQKLSLSWNFGSRVMDYSLSWTEPWAFGHPVSLGGDLFNTRRLKAYGSSSTAYTERRTGGRLRVGPRFEEDKYQLNLSYTYENVDVSDVESAYTSVISTGSKRTSTLSAEFAVDTRDNIWDPTRGWRNAVSGELTGGPLLGDEDYYKTGLSSSFSYTLFKLEEYPFVFGLSNRFGLVDRYGSRTQTVPVTERYFLGGSDTIRGYDNNGQIGPSDGGNIYYIMNAEFRFPIARERRRTIIQGAFFFDMGNSWKNFGDIKAQVGRDVTQMKTSAGFGIRFTTPAFPIRLDWGYGFNHHPGESLSEIHFTIGNLF